MSRPPSPCRSARHARALAAVRRCPACGRDSDPEPSDLGPATVPRRPTIAARLRVKRRTFESRRERGWPMGLALSAPLGHRFEVLS